MPFQRSLKQAPSGRAVLLRNLGESPGPSSMIHAERTAVDRRSAPSVFEGANPNGERQPRPLLEEGHHARQNFIQQIGRQCFDFVAMPCCQIEHAWLITADNPRRFRARKRHSEARTPGEVTSLRNWQNHGELCGQVELGWRNNEHGTVSSLLMSRCWIEGHTVNVAAIHSNSRPTASASSHSCSSADAGWE